jgi:glycosyltransferase involved in cell wall biosynthesis
MRLSIVIPSFNQGQLIGETFNSILEQDKGIDLEIIIMDGGSTDSSLTVIEQYVSKLQARGYRVINISEPDSGQSDAINKGFKLATGEIVTFLNSDDYLEPVVLKQIIERFDQPDKPKWAYGGWRYVDYNRRVYKTVQPVAYSHLRLQVICNIMQPSCFYRRDFLYSVGLLQKDLHLAMDYDLWLRMAKSTAPVLLPWIISNARYYMNTKSAKQAYQHLLETLQLQRKYSKGFYIRAVQLFYYMRALVVTALKLDINYRIEWARKMHG